MSLERKFSQLKNAPEFSLDNNWEKTTKHNLLSELHAQNRLMKIQKLTTGEKMDLLVMSFMRRLVPSTAKIVAAFLIVMMGAGTSLAAQAAVPGEPLWPVKRSIEKAEITLAMNPVKEAEIHIKHINNRLSEIDKIVGSAKNEVSPDKVAKKEKAIKQVVRHLEKDVAAVDSTLKIVKEEKKPMETVNLVKKVKDVAKETKQKANSLANEVPKEKSEVIGEALTSVAAINNAVTETVVNIAVELHQEAVAQEAQAETTAENSPAPVDEATKTELEAVKTAAVEILNDEINQISSEIQESKDKVVTSETVDAAPSEQTKQEISEVKGKTEQAESVLGEAKALLDGGSIKDAADKVLVSKEINKQAEAGLQQLTKPINTIPVNNTSTDPVIPTENNTTTIESAALPNTEIDLIEGKEVEEVK